MLLQDKEEHRCQSVEDGESGLGLCGASCRPGWVEGGRGGSLTDSRRARRGGGGRAPHPSYGESSNAGLVMAGAVPPAGHRVAPVLGCGGW